MGNNFLAKLLASVLLTPSFTEDLNVWVFFFLWFAGIIDRWELIQAQDLRNKLRMKQKLQQWQQLDSDLSDISAWLDKTEQELEELQKVKLPTSMQALEQKVKKLKVSYGLLRRGISRCWCFLISAVLGSVGSTDANSNSCATGELNCSQLRGLKRVLGKVLLSSYTEIASRSKNLFTSPFLFSCTVISTSFPCAIPLYTNQKQIEN